MITAASTAFGRSENSGASTISVASTSAPGDQRRDRRPRARPTRSASWPRGSSRPASPGARRRRRWPCPAPPTPGRRRSGSGGGWRTRGRRRRSARTRSAAARPTRCRSSAVLLAEQIECGQLRRRQPARHVPDERDAVARRGRTGQDASRPPTTSTSAPGNRGARNRSPRITASETTPTTSVVQWTSPSERSHDAELPPGVDRRRPTSRSASAARRSRRRRRPRPGSP